MLKRKSRGQSTLEYVILISFVVAALIAMGVYMKRGVQGRLKESTDQVGQQYSPGYTTSSYTTTTNIGQSENVDAGVTTTTINQNQQQKTGNEAVAEQSKEYWGS
ncbi:MAG: hypothetical protein V1869_00070 [Candidatus Omnitrophota bacterium]